MLEWILSSCLLILVVLGLRAALGKRISAGLRYGLWAVVLARLLVPVALYTAPVAGMSVNAPGVPEALREDSIYVLPVDSRPAAESGVQFAEDGSVAPFGDVSSFGYPRLTADGERVVRYADKISPLDLLGWIWIAGAAVMGLVLAVSNLRFYSRLRRVRRPMEGVSAPVPVYVAAGLPSPCLMGVLRPAVYVTKEAAADPAMLRHVLAHELTHYRHLDHWWSVLRGGALAVHWWNPLVWLAVVCSRRDGELACDEGALQELGDGERTAYGETLLALVTAKSGPGDLFRFATTMTGGGRSLRERIQRIACRPKRLVSAVVAVIAVLSLSALVAFGQAKAIPSEASPDTASPVPDGAWESAEITVSEEGVPNILYTYSNGSADVTGTPIPAPRDWAEDDLAGRNEAEYLTGSPEIRAKLVSPTEGWLVATYGRGVAAADTYVYRTGDSGINWTEVAMPGTSWHLSDVGFLSPERLIVAQRLFDGAPCLITKDGGETWEEIELPDKMVTTIHSKTVTMFVGPNETDPETYVMTSEDLGDHWTVTPVIQPNFVQADLDHDGIPDILDLRHTKDESLEIWKLQFTASYMSSPTWTGEAGSPHVGWTSFYLCRLDGEDYLLEYTPYMGGGYCEYRYKLFYLTSSGEEVVVQANSVEFDLIFDPDYAERHQYDPRSINAFMEEINALLADSELLVNTDPNLQATFEKEGRLYDSLWWLDDEDSPRDGNLTLLENLQNYGNYAQDHPDDTWSPLADLLMDLTEEDILSFGGDKSALVDLLKSAERGSRFYTWDSYEEACEGAGVEEADYKKWIIPLTDGSTLWLLASSERPSVLTILEMEDETVSAFYTALDLKETIINSDALN